MDVEGTTTSLTFVRDVLFPYSRGRLRSFVREHGGDPRVKALVEDARQVVARESGAEATEEDALGALEAWIDLDRKEVSLKALQGMIWREGYESGAFQSHVYDDVPVMLRAWKSKGLVLAIFSSGSIEAQRLLFGHSELGDLMPLLDAYFDPATAGGKREAASYGRIAEMLGLAPEELLFLSDVTEELDAAASAGLRTIQLVREGTTAGPRHAIARTFYGVAAG